MNIFQTRFSKSVLVLVVCLALLGLALRFLGIESFLRVAPKQILTSIAALVALGVLSICFSWIKNLTARSVIVLIVSVLLVVWQQLYLGAGEISPYYAARCVIEMIFGLVIVVSFFFQRKINALIENWIGSDDPDSLSDVEQQMREVAERQEKIGKVLDDIEKK